MAEATKTKKPAAKKAPTKAAPKAVPAPKASKTAPEAASDAFAVIATGGKQYVVYPGRRLRIEKLSGDHKAGDTLTFDSVLLSATAAGVSLGAPFVAGASVSATLKTIGRAKKVTVIKYKQKSRYFKKNGHRQPYFEIVIDSIK